MLYFVCVVPCVRVFVCASSSTVVLRKHAIYATVGHAQAIARRAELDARAACWAPAVVGRPRIQR